MTHPEETIQEQCGCLIEIDNQQVKIKECDVHNWEFSTEKWQKN